MLPPLNVIVFDRSHFQIMMVLLFTIIALLLLAAFWFLVPFALRKAGEARLQAQCSRLRAIVLSYDDGPGLKVTPRLLDMLEQENAKASFFVLGKNAVDKPEVLSRLVAAGHDVGSHTFHHTNAWKTAPWRAAQDIKDGIQVVQKAGGNQLLFRPPFGKMTFASFLQCKRLGLQIAWWTTDSRDSWKRRAIDDVIAEIDAKGGGVVLMHDLDHYEKSPQHPSHAEHVLALTAEIIALAKRGNYRIIPFSALGTIAAPRKSV